MTQEGPKVVYQVSKRGRYSLEYMIWHSLQLPAQSRKTSFDKL